MPGPAPIPTAILKARGSWRVSTRKGEPQPDGVIPAPPKWLDKAAKAVYREVAKWLENMHVGAKCDVNALCRYARTWVRWKQADLFIQKYGETYPNKDKAGHVTQFAPWPQVGIINRLSRELNYLEGQFGLTPAARTRISVEVPEPAKPEGKGRFFKAE